MKPRIGLFTGDPTGIGPEISAKLLAMSRTAELASVTIIADQPPDARAGVASAAAGKYTLTCLERAATAMQRGEIDAFVYAPLNKQALKLAGMKDEDDLRLFERLLRYDGNCSEVNISAGLWTTRVTSHVPLRAVADLITAEKVRDAAIVLHDALRANGKEKPRIAVAALNPHAGEGGLLGCEEIEVIAPGVALARSAGIAADGPFPADTLFIAARRGDFDGVVTMYHDQGQIATKLLGFDRGVTLLGGLPFPVATPAHGTAFDIVGKGIASTGPIEEAFAIAVRLAEARLAETQLA